MDAELVIGFKMFEEKYTSTVALDPPKHVKVTFEILRLSSHIDRSLVPHKRQSQSK